MQPRKEVSKSIVLSRSVVRIRKAEMRPRKFDAFSEVTLLRISKRNAVRESGEKCLLIIVVQNCYNERKKLVCSSFLEEYMLRIMYQSRSFSASFSENPRERAMLRCR